MWLKRGYVWDKETGKRTKADEALIERAQKGGIVREDNSNWLLVSPVKEEGAAEELAINVVKPAGTFIPEPEF